MELSDIAEGFKRAAEFAPEDLFNGLETIAKDITHEMKGRLARNGNIDTGALYDSIRQDTQRDGDVITTTVYADAMSRPYDGSTPVPYAEFIEYGTGRYNTKGDGRQTPWAYKGEPRVVAKNPETGEEVISDIYWTVGQKANPFIRPSVEGNLHRIGETAKVVLDISKYMRGK